MYFEINVSHAGQHLFATAKRSLSTEAATKALYLKLKEAFPESQGYKLDVTLWRESGESITFEANEGAQ